MQEQTPITSNFLEFREVMKQEYQESSLKWQELVKQGKAKEAVKVFNECTELEDKIYEMECCHIDKCLKDALPQMICKILNQLRVDCKCKVDVMYEKLDVLRKDGVSFKKRVEIIDEDKIDKYELYLLEPIEIPENIDVRPANKWLPMGNGYDRMKEIGVTKFVKTNFMFMYDNKNYNENN